MLPSLVSSRVKMKPLEPVSFSFPRPPPWQSDGFTLRDGSTLQALTRAFHIWDLIFLLR